MKSSLRMTWFMEGGAAGTLPHGAPWDDNGYRVLPAAAYMDHTEKMREATKILPLLG